MNCSTEIFADLDVLLNHERANIILALILNSDRYKHNKELGVYNYFCSKIFHESATFASQLQFADINKDLFLEQCEFKFYAFNAFKAMKIQEKKVFIQSLIFPVCFGSIALWHAGIR